MYTKDDILQKQMQTLHYFTTSLNLNFTRKTKEELRCLSTCLDSIHKARLIYDIDYSEYFKK